MADARRDVRVMALDVSTCSGWAVLGPDGAVVAHGQVKLGQVVGRGKDRVTGIRAYGSYPWSYLDAADEMAASLAALVRFYLPPDYLPSKGLLVVEETSAGRASSYAQKALEFIHCCLLRRLRADGRDLVSYVSTGDWRRTLGVGLTREQRAANRRVAAVNQAAAAAGGTAAEVAAARTQLKAARGVGAKTTSKHLSVEWCNANLGTALRLAENNAADALCLARAFQLGARVSTGPRNQKQ